MITIAGGGLAGLSLGVYLQKMGIQTTLYEAGKYPRHKVCGEFICGAEEEMLHEMGIENIITDSVHHREMGWWIKNEHVLQRKTPKVAWGMSRYMLDKDLSEKFQSLGGTLYLEHRMKHESLPLEGTVYGVGKSKKKRESEWVGLKVHVEDTPSGWTQGLEMHVGNRGYIGLCEVEEKRVNCCGLFKVDRAIKGKGSVLLLNYLRENALGQLADRLEVMRLDEQSFSATAGFSLGSQDVSKGFCLGDTAYLIPPFSGNGMSMAIESAYLAGKRILEFSSGGMDWDRCTSLYQGDCHRLFKKRMGLAMKLHPLLFSEFGRLFLKTSAQSEVLPINFLFNQLRTS